MQFHDFGLYIKYLFYKKPVLVLLGKSASGKSVIQNNLEATYDYKKIVTYTTRPIRINETHHKDYHFISTKNFLTKYNNDEFLEMKFYNTCNGIWYYGSSKNSYKPSVFKKIILLTPSGLDKLKESNIPHISVYLAVCDDEIKKRQELRGDATKEERERRFLADKKDFENIESKVDHVIYNEYMPIQLITSKINKIYKNEVMSKLKNRQ